MKIKNVKLLLSFLALGIIGMQNLESAFSIKPTVTKGLLLGTAALVGVTRSSNDTFAHTATVGIKHIVGGVIAYQSVHFLLNLNPSRFWFVKLPALKYISDHLF